jgi:hypothetical protein
MIILERHALYGICLNMQSSRCLVAVQSLLAVTTRHRDTSTSNADRCISSTATGTTEGMMTEP